MTMLDFLSHVRNGTLIRVRHYEFNGADYEGDVESFLDRWNVSYQGAYVVESYVDSGLMVVTYNWSPELDRY